MSRQEEFEGGQIDLTGIEATPDRYGTDYSDKAGESVPCAYCKKPTATKDRSPGAGVWHWPGKGLVTNCKSCAGDE